MNLTQNRLKTTLERAERSKHPDYPKHLSLPVKLPKRIDTANGMQHAIVSFVKAHNLNAERVNVMGIPIDNRKIVTDSVGFQRLIGSIEYRPSMSRKGSADVHASIPIHGSNGFAVSCKFEIKAPGDRIRPEQVKYGEEVIRSGGVYVIIRSFDEFLEWWDENADMDRIDKV